MMKIPTHISHNIKIRFCFVRSVTVAVILKHQSKYLRFKIITFSFIK